ncbi:LOW QUALITY PROTEIN: hypothetical protein OSB04_016679 [Centaurea solstitialis]|uniref:Uncharacterized protein n=1 Tax=Centaurea solstitialis TaxID=347529 RepID=A0AA38WJZ0_9ASTR|nr:LOW QUALITY PROTEIN: hypothetical protein OSB04_016679 [Centaurea solstitialis]
MSSSKTHCDKSIAGQAEQNPRGQINSIVLRDGKILGEVEPKKKGAAPKINEGEKTTQVGNSPVEGMVEVPTQAPILAQAPIVPFPSRLAKAKLEAKFSNNYTSQFRLWMLLPRFLLYAKFLKDLISTKRRSGIVLFEECSALITTVFPEKLGDPGSFSIPCFISGLSIHQALCDLRASVRLTPLTIASKGGVEGHKNISFQLADRSIKYPVGVLEDLPLQVGNFIIPCDFVVLEMIEDINTPIILGRPFLANAGTIIDVKNGKLSLNVGREKVEFELRKSMGLPSVGF